MQIQQASDITDDWIMYIREEVTALSKLTTPQINHYADRVIFNPDMIELLETTDFSDEPNTRSMELSLGFESASLLDGKGFDLKARFKGLKEKMRKIFCKVMADIQDRDEFDLEEIIKIVLTAIIAALAISINAVILPLVIAIIASFVKLGYTKVCPI